MRKSLSVLIILFSSFWAYHHYDHFWKQREIFICFGYTEEWILMVNIVFGFIGVGLGTISLIKKISIIATILLNIALFIIGIMLQLNLSDFGINI
jgi:hypothetical protein